MSEQNAIAPTNQHHAGTPSIDWDTLEKVVVRGDLSQLSTEERMIHYRTVCQSVGLNPATQPFEYIKLSGKLTLYPKRDATDQLRRIHRVSITIVDRQQLNDVYIVTARATTPDGRADESTGVVSIGNLKGDNLANALMKAETKAKRRVTLSICGLGMLDESELDTVRGAQTYSVEQAHSHEPVTTPALEPPGDGPTLASDKQIKLISKLAADAGYDDESLRATWLKPHYKVESRKELTKDKASDLINWLQADVLGQRLQAATSIDELNAVAAEVKEAGITGRALKGLRETYEEQHSALAHVDDEAPPADAPEPNPDEEAELDAAFEAAEQTEMV